MTEISRRDALIGSAAAATAFGLGLPAEADFIPAPKPLPMLGQLGVEPWEFGNCIDFAAHPISTKMRHYVSRILSADAAKELPAGMKFELRESGPTSIRPLGGMAWYAIPGIQDLPAPVTHNPPFWSDDLGYYLVGRHEVGA